MAGSHARHLLPLPISSQLNRPLTKKKKRKRNPIEGDDELPPDQAETETEDAEYTAVISPEERLQRRLAGQPLDRSPPAHPFPHAPLSALNLSTSPIEKSSDLTDFNNMSATHAETDALRLQHLATMTAIVHRCLQAKDYLRASRALGLIVRSEIHGKSIDLRHGGLWGMAGEILLLGVDETAPPTVARQAFDKVKMFYNKMALQHPWHRSWPHVTNAQDFKLAMFGIWILITSQESKTLQQVDLISDPRLPAANQERLIEAKQWERSEATRIAQEMDTLLQSVPFVDDVELIRLRGMVALWIADLHDAVDSLNADLESNISLQDRDLERAWLGEDMNEQPQSPQAKQKAINARQLAAVMFAKVGLRRDGRRTASRDFSDDPVDSDG